jgi:ADP-ribose pyrophosphatase
LRWDELERQDGKVVGREVLEHPGATAILARQYSDRDAPLIVLVRQYRWPAQRSLWEIPAGTLEPGEDPLACAQRELWEETGLRAKRWRPLLAFYTTPGFCTEFMHLFLAEGVYAETDGRRSSSEAEQIEVGFFTPDDVSQMIRRGEIQDAKSLVGLLALETDLIAE